MIGGHYRGQGAMGWKMMLPGNSDVSVLYNGAYNCSLYCSAQYGDWRWRLETCVEQQTRLETTWEVCTGQTNKITSNLYFVIMTNNKVQHYPYLDYFDPQKQTDLPSCCGDDQVYSLKDQVCISLDKTRARHPFSGCGGENNTTITLVTNEKVNMKFLD